MAEFIKTQQLIQNLWIEKTVPGISYGLITRHKITTDYAGDSQWVPESKKLQPNQYYDLASLTKVMTTTPMILKMIATGQLQLTTPIQKFLPEFKDPRVQIWHLLTHTSGITGYIPHRNELPAAALKQALLGLEVGPGFEKEVKYTDIGLIFLGFIIESVYQKPVQTVLTEKILRPLGLFESTFTPVPNLTVPTTYLNGTLLQGRVHDPKAQILGCHCASAGLFSTLPDILKFAKFMLGQYRPDQAPITQAEVATLFHNYSGLADQPRSLGWDLRRQAQDGHFILYHTGFTGTFMLVDRKNQNALVVLSNRIHPTGQNELFLQKRALIVDAFCEESKGVIQ